MANKKVARKKRAARPVIGRPRFGREVLSEKMSFRVSVSEKRRIVRVGKRADGKKGHGDWCRDVLNKAALKLDARQAAARKAARAR